MIFTTHASIIWLKYIIGKTIFVLSFMDRIVSCETQYCRRVCAVQKYPPNHKLRLILKNTCEFEV